jgi:hypothetical protein
MEIRVWDKFFSAQIDTELVHRAIAKFHLRPDMRWFKSEAGCTLVPCAHRLVNISFEGVREHLDNFAWFLGENQEAQFLAHCSKRVDPFAESWHQLGADGWVEKVKQSSRLSVSDIANRIFSLSPVGEWAIPEELQTLEEFADEQRTAGDIISTAIPC